MVAVEVTEDGTQNDPFDGQKEDVYWGSDKRQQIWDELSEHAEHVFRYQRRTALLMILVIGRSFRFLRWDRSGTIVTPSIDYYMKPQVLCGMLWRMAQLSNEELGCDPSATRLWRQDADYITMNALSLPHAEDLDHTDDAEVPDAEGYRVFRYVREMFSHSIQGNWPRYRLEVVQDGKKFFFLVGKPTFQNECMAGRGTQGFVAYDLQRERFVWLKDVWRAHYDFVDQEGTILMRLNSTKDAAGKLDPVKNVPTIVCHGDVRGQTTRTPDFWEMKNMAPAAQGIKSSPSIQDTHAQSVGSRTEEISTFVKGRKRTRAEAEESASVLDACPLRRHTHYRIVVEEVAMPLTKFTSGHQLLTIILDCIIAHKDAVEKAKIMHRDISGGNILIYPRIMLLEGCDTTRVLWRGLLADWELSKPIGGVHDDRTARRERMGTWQYMSVAVLLDHSKDVELSDELESFFHVLLYHALRYLRSNCTAVGSFIEHFFDSSTEGVDGRDCCGYLKMRIMTGNMPLAILPLCTELIKFDSEPLNDMFSELLAVFKAHYAVRDYNAHNRPRPPKPSKPEESKPLVLPRFALARRRYYRALIGLTGDEQPLTSKPEPARLPKPSDEVYANAQMASSHGAILSIVHDAWNRRKWGEFTLDRVEDNALVTYKARGRVRPEDTTTMSTVKRRKIETIHERAGVVPEASSRPPRKAGTCKI
ncbi:hypothetical protein C8Q77DRAFT_1177749 [Trametes polyzona]|nr:hypothetical protein C8Q77DRAFT_1177749 [Trametes polyzona]